MLNKFWGLSKVLSPMGYLFDILTNRASLVILMLIGIVVLKHGVLRMDTLFFLVEILYLWVLRNNLLSLVRVVSLSIMVWHIPLLRLSWSLIFFDSFMSYLLIVQPFYVISEVPYFSVRIQFLTNEPNMSILITIWFENLLPLVYYKLGLFLVSCKWKIFLPRVFQSLYLRVFITSFVLDHHPYTWRGN